MKVKFMNLGRSKFNGEVEIKCSSGILFEARKHLISSHVSVNWITETEGTISTGFHIVGKFEVRA